jgi:hypothetical protein
VAHEDVDVDVDVGLGFVFTFLCIMASGRNLSLYNTLTYRLGQHRGTYDGLN